ncbi:disease resistance protein TAO1-like [Neltuma alba]|uniref:disease resistance protein TAO1-like n=1 Tax=Neltuma alba TaxID=207710 RepID=UPI0010A4DC6C|nr:disease resistance protein TAO1-like [Prosopis alba]
MYDLIEDTGKEIDRQESPYEPGGRSRLWFYKDILHVLQQDSGTHQIEAIFLDLPESIEVQWSGEAFMKMKNLKMLVIRKTCFSECPKYLPKSLRWLEWKGCSFKFLPSLWPTELVYLDLSFSYCELLQPFDKAFHNISCMNLRNCKFLQQIPDFSGASNLRELWLDGCTNLIRIHDSVGCLNELTELSAMRCKNLKILPSCLKLTSLKHLNLFGCSSLQTFPEVLVMMEKMRTLDLDKTAITELPSSICNLIGLEILHMEECPNLMQLPASICTLPNLWKLTANSCEGMSHFKMCEAGGEASVGCSAMALKMEQLFFSHCNLSDDSLAFCLANFTNMIHLDMSFNNFTILPRCIREYHNLKYLLLDNCYKLKHIGGMPPNLEKFSAIRCTSLTKLSKNKVMEQAINFQSGKRNFILPGEKFPEGLHNYSGEKFVSFWVRNMFPTTLIWILVKDDRDYAYSCQFSVDIDEYTKLGISSMWSSLSPIKTNHIYICDMQSMIHSTELPITNEWSQVKVSIQSTTQETEGEKEIYFGVHVHDLQSNLENIQFLQPVDNSTKEGLEIMSCPLLASSIPECSNIHQFAIIKSPNAVLQEQELPPSLRRLAVSGGHMLEPLSEKLHIEDLTVDCSDAVPPAVIHIPASVKQLEMRNCENLKAFFGFKGTSSSSPKDFHLQMQVSAVLV